jgi:tetratricopeptide (TPR) repeat protein
MRWSSGEPTLEFELERQHDVLGELGERCILAEKYHWAKQFYEAACALVPGNATPHVKLGTLAAREGKLDRAQACFETARRMDPQCADAYGGLAMVCQQRGEYAPAFDLYLQCLEKDVDNLIALLGLFQTSCQMGTFGKIIHFLEIYLAKHPADVSVEFCLASLYVKEGKLAQARDALGHLLSLEPGKEEARELLEDVQRDLRARGQQPTKRIPPEAVCCQTMVRPSPTNGAS